LEKIYKKEWLHGEYMALGMVAAFDLAHKLNFCKVDTYKRVRKHLKSMGLPVYFPEGFEVNIDEIIENINYETPIILPTNIGHVVEYKKDISKDMLIQVIKNLID
jgi:3-dehydroquinate synthase